MEFSVKMIARIETEFSEKFGIPRQSGLVESALGKIVFEPEYRTADALRGLEGYSHIWIIWQFSKAVRDTWSPTVRPPRLGGNKRMGVFATRSPFRPNAIGLSCVKIEKIDLEKVEIYVSGVDMLSGTPIIDIKPYLPYVDIRNDAVGGFAQERKDYALQVNIPPDKLEKIPQEHRISVREILTQDPRPSYQEDGERIYGMTYGGCEIKFQVSDGILTVTNVEKSEK